MKPKFKIGQVVAFRAEDGGWEYDRIQSIRKFAAKQHNESAWLDRSTFRIETRHLRPLTKRERGEGAKGRMSDKRELIVDGYARGACGYNSLWKISANCLTISMPPDLGGALPAERQPLPKETSK